MAIAKKIRETLRKFDFFGTTNFLRYREEVDYQTLTGGVCSLGLIIFFITIFTSLIIKTINKSDIKWGYTIFEQVQEPLKLRVDTVSDAKFIFAVGIDNLEMHGNGTERYFDVFLKQTTIFGGNLTEKQINMVPCNRTSWVGAQEETITEIYDRVGFNKFYCPPDNFQFQVEGKQTSKQYQYLSITVKKCNSSLDPSRPCVNDTVIDDYISENEHFNLNLYFLNSLMNPTRPEELAFYLEDRNYIPFTKSNGGIINIYMSKYQSQTDQSIIPIEEIKKNQGGLANFLGHFLSKVVHKDEYATINFKRSTVTMAITRNYIKLDQILAYIGGLFTTVMIMLLFMNFYTEYSFEVQMGDRLFYYNNQKAAIKHYKFNVFTYLAYLFFSFFSYFNCQPEWPTMQRYDECRNQIKKQLDINLIMKRLIFMERCLRIIFDDHQFKLLHMGDRMSLKEAESCRREYQLRDKFKRESEEPRNQNNVTENILNGLHNIVIQQLGQIQESNVVVPQKKTTRKVIPMEQIKEQKEEEEPDDHPTNNQIEASSKLMRKPTLRTITEKLSLLKRESQEGNLLSRKIIQTLDNKILNSLILGRPEREESHMRQIEDARSPQESIQQSQSRSQIKKEGIRIREDSVENYSEAFEYNLNQSQQ